MPIITLASHYLCPMKMFEAKVVDADNNRRQENRELHVSQGCMARPKQNK